MFSYRYTGELPAIIGHLTHGPTVTVERGGSTLVGDDDGQPVALEHTVELEPGDLLYVDHLEEHAFLEPADAATRAAHADAAKLPTKKSELQELARARGLDDSGTVAELTDRLSA